MNMTLFLSITVLLFSCTGNHDNRVKTSASNFTVIDEEVLDIPGKGQISTYVLYNDTIYKEDVLNKIAFEIYNENQKKLLPDNEPAKIFMVYIYSKKSDYESDKTKCIAMLYKGLNESQPEIAYTLPGGLPEASLSEPDAELVVDSSFEILSEKKSETSSKAQLIEYAWYKDSIYTEDVLRATIMEIYELNRNKSVFSMHEKPTVIAVYLFTSKEASKDKSDWIAMLIKEANETEPRVSFNRFKVSALNNVKDATKTTDEIELDRLNEYLNKRGLELCSLADLLKKIELDNIHKADAQYPDYGDEHMAMIDRLDAKSYAALRKKHNLNEDMLGKVSVFAMAYCK